MRALSKGGIPAWPSWAGGDDFRRRAESALTHPATVAALGVLLLNDLLLKALWPHSWLTGKLSDLAWLVFAPPLLAFLLSFATRGNLRAQRLAFLVAYVGLPLLYAAFNTFDPVHELIMRGISLAGGAAGSPATPRTPSSSRSRGLSPSGSGAAGPPPPAPCDCAGPC